MYVGDDNTPEVIEFPCPYIPDHPPSHVLGTNNNNNNNSAPTLPRSQSEIIPDYFVGDPSVMVNSKSDHSIKIHMTGDTMQVEIVSPPIAATAKSGGAGEEEEEEEDIDYRDRDHNLSTDFDLVFKVPYHTLAIVCVFWV